MTALGFALLVILMLGLVTAPLAAEAQQPTRLPRVVFLTVAAWTPESMHLFEAFRQGLRKLGYVEGRNVIAETRSAGTIERVPDVVAELSRHKVDVIVAATPRTVLAARQATTTIPIVFTAIIDPVGAGLVASLARPPICPWSSRPGSSWS